MSDVDLSGMLQGMQIELVDTVALIPYSRNSRKHEDWQIDKIAASMKEFGWTQPILTDGDGMIIAGHGRLMAAQKLGLPKVPTIRLEHLSDAQRRALVIWDNRSAEIGNSWDLEFLKVELDDLRDLGFDMELTGFDDDVLSEMFGEPETSNDKDPEEVPPEPDEPVSRLGDIWVCGPHRVGCIDSTSTDDWERLMQGERADLCITDPPYNVAYESKLAGSIKNDDMSDSNFRQFLLDAYAAMFAMMKPGAPIYVAHADTEGLNFRSTFREAGFKLSGCLIWRKNSLVLGRSDYQWMHEPILYGWKPGAAHRWYGGRKRTTIIEHGDGGAIRQLEDGRWAIQVGDQTLIVSGEATLEEQPNSLIYHDKPSRSELHPTTKPVGLWEKLMRPSARSGDVVIDPFSGSGTTLIAADRMGMIARVAELDPKFVDVAVVRWQQYTGRRAVHAVTGEPFPGEGELREPEALPPVEVEDADVF
jgi:DNA modification methylase